MRSGPTLTATTTAGQTQVALTWTAADVSVWTPTPAVSYTLYRDDGTTIEAIETNLTGLSHTDTGVTIDDDYTYWVAAVVDGGEAARSAPVSVIAGAGNQPPVPVGIIADRQLTAGSMAVEVDVAAAFRDPDSDTLTFWGKLFADIRRHGEQGGLRGDDHTGERGPDDHHRDGDRRGRVQYERVVALHSDGWPRLRRRRRRADRHQ